MSSGGARNLQVSLYVIFQQLNYSYLIPDQ